MQSLSKTYPTFWQKLMRWSLILYGNLRILNTQINFSKSLSYEHLSYKDSHMYGAKLTVTIYKQIQPMTNSGTEHVHKSEIYCIETDDHSRRTHVSQLQSRSISTCCLNISVSFSLLLSC